MADKIEQQRAHFNKIAQTYYDARRDPNHLLIKKLIWLEFFRRWPGPRHDGLKVLEPMCGFAEGKDIIEQGLGVTVSYSGFDYSDEVVTKIHQTRPDLDIRCADVTKFEPAETYDIIILLGGLHHVPDAASIAVARLAAGLRPGGYFINLEPTHGNTLFRMVRDAIYQRNRLFDEKTERAFFVGDLFKIFEDAGFEYADSMNPGLLSHILYYNPDAFPYLNWGGARTVRTVFAVDRPFLRNTIGRFLSFATLSLWRKV
jgi:SAM-dependent methyltransferase